LSSVFNASGFRGRRQPGFALVQVNCSDLPFLSPISKLHAGAEELAIFDTGFCLQCCRSLALSAFEVTRRRRLDAFNIELGIRWQAGEAKSSTLTARCTVDECSEDCLANYLALLLRSNFRTTITDDIKIRDHPASASVAGISGNCRRI
jgi:hypothetical protein